MRMMQALGPAVWVGAVALAAPMAQAQDEDLLVDLRFAGLGQLEPTAKDAAAYRALMMLGDRLAEIPGETGGPEEARRAIGLGWEALVARSGVRIELGHGESPIEFSLTLSPAGDELAAKHFLDRLNSLIEDSGGPIEPDGDGFVLQTPQMPVRLLNQDVQNRPSMVAVYGEVDPAQTTPQTFDLPQSATSSLSGMIDLSKLLGMAYQGIEAQGDEEAMAFFENFSWFFSDAPVMDFAYGSDDDFTYVTSRLHDSSDWLARMGTDPEVVLTKSDFADVPRDATGLAAGPVSFDFVTALLDMNERDTGEDLLAPIDEMLGVDLRHDVLENLGPRLIAYESDRTGGGGFLSGVVLCDVRDSAALARVHSELRQRINDLAAEQARGYFKIRTWSTAGHDVYSIATPGLPVPIEISWTIMGEQLVLAVSPRGLVEAVNQIEHGTDSIVDNPDFAGAVLDLMEGRRVSSVAYRDSARFARDGYSGMNILLSGLANAVRSPGGADREPGVLMPPYAEFLDGVKRVCVLTYWDGEDYVMYSRMDPSMLVEIADAIGQYGGAMGVSQIAALQVGVLLPSLGKARESAKQLKSASQIRALAQVMILYLDDSDTAPKSFKDLIDAGYVDEMVIDSPYGPCPIGGPSIAMRTDLAPEQLGSFNARLVIAIDRTMYVQGEDGINVGFADGHVESLDRWSVDELLDQDINKGARENLGL